MMKLYESKSEVAELSKLLFDRFVVNDRSVAFQLSDGTYRRRDVPVTPFLIEAMLRYRGSLGCYQQQYKTGNIRWICFDFDCADKSNPNIVELFNGVIGPLGRILDRLGIHYLEEFSGRRGVHVWILFSEIIDKSDGFSILTEIERLLRSEVGDFDERRWHLDRFPATGSSAGNTVGKQVKIPLSTHASGGRSFFFQDSTPTFDVLEFNDFIRGQLEILQGYKENDPAKVKESLGIRIAGDIQKNDPIAWRYALVDDEGITAEDFIQDLSEITVFKEIFHRLRRGISDFRDRAVLFGTVSCLSSGVPLLQDVLSRFPGYDAEKTDDYVARLKGHYYPATFGYLYNLYGMRPETDLDLEETGFGYVMSKRGLKLDAKNWSFPLSEKEALLSVSSTVRKEIEYLHLNDEATDVGIYNDLRMMNERERAAIQGEMEAIESGAPSSKGPSGYRIFNRREDSMRHRELVSLSAYDRVLTTHAALRLCAMMGVQWDSFSYHVDLMSRSSIFSQWYYSWKDYRAHIKPFLEIPFFGEYEVFAIDLKACYDHVDLLGAYQGISNDLASSECDNLFRYLVRFNDALMSRMHDGSRLGVPQGPAYARIIAEMFLDKTLESILGSDGRSGLTVLRYVDDMTFFCEPGLDSEGLFDELCGGLAKYGLPVNRDKSRCYGQIASLTAGERQEIAHENSFNYALHENDYTGKLLVRERRAKARDYLDANLFDINALGLVFGAKVVPEAKERCFNEHRCGILSSEIGRGLHFKRFYQYMFEDDDRVLTVLEENGFSLIPIGSVNFSNFVDELYFAYMRKGDRFRSTLTRIAHDYLETLDLTMMDEGDASTVKALILIAGQE